MTQHDKRTATPTVSIGMPVYNGEKFIRKAIDSLLAQTFTDFELIISDNVCEQLDRQSLQVVPVPRAP